MRINEVRCYRVALPLAEGRYAWSGGKSVETFESTVVALGTDAGLTGWGEVCPLGPAYLPAYAEGARAGIAVLAPRLIGVDPRDLGLLLRRLETDLKGHPYIKSPIDMACHDLLGKAAGLPLVTVLGGRDGAGIELYRAISQEAPERMAQRVSGYRREGYRKFQLKVGGQADEDIERIHATRAVLGPGELLVADANTGWTTHQALRVVRAIRSLDVYIEQPCLTLEECLIVRRATDLPMVLDESIQDVHALLHAHRAGAMDAVNIKISKLGGIANARLLRDLCCHLGLAMTIEDSWGGDITTAAIAHLAQSTPAALRLSATDFNSYGAKRIASGAPRRQGGQMSASTAPGLGVEPIEDELGEPVLLVR
jgi:cis-L-3-hydroxyproline dehydratase